MQVRRLPKDPGPAGWNVLVQPPPPPPRRQEGKETADVVVIGAGFAGLAAARRVAQLDPAARIVVLEAVRVGEGPAGRNSGFMIDLPHDLASNDYGGALEVDRAQIAANRAAIDFAAGMAEDFGLPDAAFARVGKVNGAATARGQGHNRSYARHLAALGESHEMLDGAQMRALTGTSYYRGGLFTPGTAMLQPAMFVRGVAEGLVSNRVSICEESPVTGLRPAGSDWVAETPRGQVSAPRVILAVNGHLESFGHMVGRLMHVFTYASMTRALTQDELHRLGGAPRWGLTPADPMGTTVRKIDGPGGVRLVIRNRFTLDPAMEVGPARISRVARDHDKAFAARFPMLHGVEMDMRWGGRLCLSRNGAGVTRELEPGLFAACVQNGLGTARGTLAGMLAAEMAVGAPSDMARAAAAAVSPTPAPSFIAPAANAFLRWQEWRAGREL